MVLVGRTKLRVSKNFLGDIFLYLLNIFANAAPKLKQKNIKNYGSILAIVNHRNWLDDSPPLQTFLLNIPACKLNIVGSSAALHSQANQLLKDLQ